MRALHPLWVGAALLLVVISGIQVTWSSQKVRLMHAEIQVIQREYDSRLAENSRLLLERSVEASYQNVERYAKDQLGMVFPENVRQVKR